MVFHHPVRPCQISKYPFLLKAKQQEPAALFWGNAALLTRAIGSKTDVFEVLLAADLAQLGVSTSSLSFQSFSEPLMQEGSGAKWPVDEIQPHSLGLVWLSTNMCRGSQRLLPILGGAKWTLSISFRLRMIIPTPN